MAKITRKTAKLFATTGAGTDVEQFASFEVNGAPNYTTSPAVIMALPAWRLGWSSTQLDGIFAPYFQDRNGVDLVTFYQIAYLLQQSIAEWDSATPYFNRSIVQNGGTIFMSLQDNNTGNAPPAGASNSFWLLVAFPSSGQAKSPTRTVYTSGSGTYTPPAGCTRIFVRIVGGGAGGGSANNVANFGTNGGATTFSTITANGGVGGASCNNGQVSGPGVGAGGAGGSASGGDVNISGGVGGTGINNYPTMNRNGRGGSSRFECLPSIDIGSNPSDWIIPGNNAPANSGAGGSGGYFNYNYSGQGWAYPGGGGAGGYAEKTIYSPSAVSYAVGAGGAGATSGGGAQYIGGNGAAGIIIIDEYYY